MIKCAEVAEEVDGWRNVEGTGTSAYVINLSSDDWTMDFFFSWWISLQHANLSSKPLCISNNCNELGSIFLNLANAEDVSLNATANCLIMKCHAWTVSASGCCLTFATFHPINSSLGNSAPEASRSSALATSLSNSSCTGCFTVLLDSTHIFC